MEPLGVHVKQGAETFRPGDRVQLVDYDRYAPAYLVGLPGTIKTMHEGRGRQRGKWFATVLFDASTKPRRIPLRSLRRVL